MASNKPHSPKVKPCPFDVIVITSPDAESAHAVRDLIATTCGDFSASPTASTDSSASSASAASSSTATEPQQSNKSNKSNNDDNDDVSILQSTDGTLFLSSYDPYGARMGSGGGTLAALAEADEAYANHWRGKGCLHSNNENERVNEINAETNSRASETGAGPFQTTEHSSNSPLPTVLICHAGGESSRCPTQIVLGKAWTSLPIRNKNDESQLTYSSSSNSNGSVTVATSSTGTTSLATSSTSSKSTTSTSTASLATTATTVSNPTSLLLSSLSHLFIDVPKGSVIVAASDVLLSFQRDTTGDSSNLKKINFEKVMKTNQTNSSNEDANNHVFGLAVPAPLNTAKNHGVFVLNSKCFNDSNDSNGKYGGDWTIQPTCNVLQKPTVEEMKGMANPSCVFYNNHNADDANHASNASNVNHGANANDNSGEQGEQMAWIDTGVVTFLPGAAKTLRTLSRSILSCCTRRGLKRSYDREYGGFSHCAGSVGSAGMSAMSGISEMSGMSGMAEGGAKRQKVTRVPSLEEYARKNAMKIDLYSDMLQALSFPGSSSPINSLPMPEQSQHCEAFLKKRGIGNVPPETNRWILLFEELSKLELYTCAVPSGCFIHLGTTSELCDFLALGSSCLDVASVDGADEGGSVMTMRGQAVGQNLERIAYRKRNKLFGKSIGLTRRANSFVAGFDPEDTLSSVVLSSVLVSKGNGGSVGKGSVVEHCQMECEDNGIIDIGERCLLSGIRGKWKGCSGFSVPSGLCLQMLPLHQSQSGDCPSFVCLCLGVEDQIKEVPPSTIFGMDLSYVLKRSGLDESDLWDASISPSKRMVWNARLNPVLRSSASGTTFDFSFLDWLSYLSKDYKKYLSNGMKKGAEWESLSPLAISGLRMWRESKRLSISEVRQRVNSKAEANFRRYISPTLLEESCCRCVSEILLNRRNESFSFDYVFDAVPSSFSTSTLLCGPLLTALEALDSVVKEAFSRGLFDVVGRTWMTMSLMIFDASSLLQKLETREYNGHKIQEESSSGQINPVEPGEFDDEEIASAIQGLRSFDVSSEAIIKRISSIRDFLLRNKGFFLHNAEKCVGFLESAASVMTERCISGTTSQSPYPCWHRQAPIPMGSTAVAAAPARIDLSGGWSDTPPISFEHGGSVACLAVLIDGKRPLRAHCKMVEGGKGIVLRTESRSSIDEKLIASTEVTILTLGDLAGYRNPHSDCSLLKCALIYLGLADCLCSVDQTQSILPYLREFCKSDETDFGLEIVSSSLLPTGSGMGGSSILGGCILAAIAKCVGISLTGSPSQQSEKNSENSHNETTDSDSIVHAVLMLEQLLTSGGGWQDQIGGLVGGLKLGTSDANVLPLRTKVHHFPLPPSVVNELNERMILTFTGQPRLAKNILQNVLRRWARRSSDIVDTVRDLVIGASDAITCLKDGDLDGLGSCMSLYWRQKIVMAGVESGVEPKPVKKMLDLLTSEGDIVGGTLCGAGGGGFLAVLASKGKAMSDVKSRVEKAVADGHGDLGCFSWHTCTVASEGLVVKVVNGTA